MKATDLKNTYMKTTHTMWVVILPTVSLESLCRNICEYTFNAKIKECQAIKKACAKKKKARPRLIVQT